MILDDRPVPIVLAPLAGGPSTPELAAAVSGAGGFGFLGAGYLSPGDLAGRIAATRRLTGEPFGVNLFVPGPPSDPEPVRRYAATLAADARAAGAELGRPRSDDDAWDAKLALLVADPVPVVSFTFGRPDAATVARLRATGSEVWVTVTSAADAEAAAEVGADVLVVQGVEAGGHRGGFDDDPDGALGLIALLQVVAARVDRPLVATGGLMTGAAIAAVLTLGARAAALGTAFMDCPEAGTSPAQRQALRTGGPTALTRAFTGRTARGLRNRFLDEHSADAPRAYPEVHYLTSPLRQAARAAGDPSVLNLWAGQAVDLLRPAPAGDLVRLLADETTAALAATRRRHPPTP